MGWGLWEGLEGKGIGKWCNYVKILRTIFKKKRKDSVAHICNSTIPVVSREVET